MTRTFDLFSQNFKADPFPTFAAMREAAPVYPHRAPDGSTIWYITGYDDAIAVLKDHERFVKDHRRARSRRGSLYASPNRNIHKAINENMLFADPPDHTRLKALVSLAFTPVRVREMAPQVQAIVDRLLDAVAADGRMDLIASFALPLPVTVICDMLGIPGSDHSQICDWSQAVISPGSRGLNYGARKRKIRRFVAYLRALFADRRQRPEDDLVSALVQAEMAGDRLTEPELSSMVALLIVTGHETTVNLIGNGVLALLQHPDQLAQLKQEPELIDSAVEELLRFDGPVETSTTRWAAEDVFLHGHLIRRGDVVRVVLASANRDATQFDRPDELDLTRHDRRHLAFGHGIHYCLGAPLARLEGRIALTTLWRRLPSLGLALPAAELRWRPGVLFRGLESLPVVWSRP